MSDVIPGIPPEQGSSATSGPPEPTLVGHTLAGGLQVLDQLGSTPEGPLYRAEYPTGLEVALLLLRPEAGGDPATLERLRQQFRQAIQIQHPNVAAVHAMGETDDGTYVVLEHLDGELLSNILVERGALPLLEAVDLCLQVAAGLQAAHGVGFLHGNLSPDAILVAQEAGERPRVKLIRFTLASSFRGGEGQAIDGEVSAEYASPERLAGDRPDERSDVFSLGAVLHHLLTGMPPGPESGEGSIPDVMRAVLTSALNPDPGQRFQTISELASAVELAAVFVSKPRRPRTNRALIPGAAAVTAVAVLALGFWLLRSSQGPPAEGAARPSPETSTRPPVRAEPAESATTRSMLSATPPTAPPQTPSQPPRAAKPAPAPPTARQENRSAEVAAELARVLRRAAAAAATAKLDQQRRATPDPIETAMAPTPLPSPAPAPPAPTLEQRAQVYIRVGLDEASRQLDGPVHAIEGMTPTFIGLADGRMSAGADTTRAVVRVVYLDSNGRLILLDQQRIPSGQNVPVATGSRWPIGEVMVYLHGEAPPETIRNLRGRVR